jgi:hypothetical protein
LTTKIEASKNAIFRPSGDQVTNVSVISWVRARFPLPSALMTKIRFDRPSYAAKAMVRPSGAQAAAYSSASCVCVRFRCPLPSALIT